MVNKTISGMSESYVTLLIVLTVVHTLYLLCDLAESRDMCLT